MKIVAVNGSPRRNGNTRLLLEAVLAPLAKAGWETELVQAGGKNLHGCRACRRCFENQDRRCSYDDDEFNGIYEKLLAADAMVIGSPTYFADITPEAKAFIDRAGYVAMANGGLFAGKIGAGVVAVRRAGAVHAFDSINHMFLICRMIVPGSMYWNIGFGRERGEVEKDEEGIRTMITLGRNMAWLMKKVGAEQASR